jgi:hypothetical protein
MNATHAESVTTDNSQVLSQALWFFLHALFSLMAWGVTMLVVTLFRPGSVQPAITLALSLWFTFFSLDRDVTRILHINLLRFSWKGRSSQLNDLHYLRFDRVVFRSSRK